MIGARTSWDTVVGCRDAPLFCRTWPAENMAAGSVDTPSAMSGPSSAKTISELRGLSDGDLIEQHDALANHTQVGVDYYLSELNRRVANRQGRRMEQLTIVIGGLTLINVAAVVVDIVAR